MNTIGPSQTALTPARSSSVRPPPIAGRSVDSSLDSAERTQDGRPTRIPRYGDSHALFAYNRQAEPEREQRPVIDLYI